VFFVNLTPLQSADTIVPTVAQALGFSFYEGGEPRQQLLDYVRQKSLLLIMDNYEHLLDGVGLVTEILKTALDVSVLATSRAGLNIRGEQLFLVGGMDVPDVETIEDASRYSAVQLFLSGARQIQPGFEATDDVLQDVVRICRLVEGMPLGIELAAAWVGMLTPAEIAAEISQNLDFLETDLRDVPERQRSMRAVFDHSWRLLTERERELFQGLSVFRGGFTRDAAQEVSGASPRELKALVNKSLLQRTPAGRYQVHELLRQYAAGKLEDSGKAEAVRDAHGAYYAAALERWERDLKGARQRTTLTEMGVEIENAHAAWNWAVERVQVTRLDQALGGLSSYYWWHLRYEEGDAVCRLAMEGLATKVSGDELRVLAKIIAVRSVFLETVEASRLLQQSLALLDKPELAEEDTRGEKAFALLQMGGRLPDSDRGGARQLFEQSLGLYQALGFRWGSANALHSLGLIALHSGVYHDAQRLFEESMAIRRELGDLRGVASSLQVLSTVALNQGQLEEAESLVQESDAICQEMGDRHSIVRGRYVLGVTLVTLGEYVRARSLLEESVELFNDLGWRSNLAAAKLALSSAEVNLGQYKQAYAQVVTGLTILREIGHRRGIGTAHWLLGALDLAMEAYAEAHHLLQESIAIFREIGQKDELALALAFLGYAARGLGNFPEAKRCLSAALRTSAAIGYFYPPLYALPAIALLLADIGNTVSGDTVHKKKEQAVELYALASHHPGVANSRWFEDVAGKRIAAVAASLPPEVVAAAQERGRARDLDATMAELLAELERE
jgi:predicted ATPase